MRFILPIVLFCVFIAELCTGIAIIGWLGDHAVVERTKSPGPYWFSILLQTFIILAIFGFLTMGT